MQKSVPYILSAVAVVARFAAHYDAGRYMMGHLFSHGQPVYRLNLSPLTVDDGRD